MSLEKSIQDLTQAVGILTKSVDLNTAVVGELNGNYMAVLSALGTTAQDLTAQAAPIVKQEAAASAKKAADNKAAAAEQAATTEQAAETTQPLTDEEIKALPVFNKIVAAMMAFTEATKARNGGDEAEARADTLKILRSYSDDGKVTSLVRAVMENDNLEVIDELLNIYNSKTNELIASNAENVAGSDDDFGGEEETTATYTADDVKAALQAYAKIEGRPAAIALLKKLSNGRSQVKDLDPSEYGAIVEGLKAG